MTQSISLRLAEFASAFDAARIPPPARHAGRRTILNAVALAVSSSHHPAVTATLEAVRAMSTPPRASVLGRSERVGTAWAALLNGMAVHVEDFDDTHLRTVIHPGAPIVPAALAVGEEVAASGAETVTAVVIGTEIALRVGNSISPGHFDRGWHLTGTMGHLGAAAAAGRLLGLTPEQMVAALGLAATQAAGLQEALGTMTKSFHAGKAAADGVEAALLARAGFTGPAEPIEGRRGLLNVSAPAPRPKVIGENLGAQWEIESNTFKPYPCGIVSHPVIDAGIALRDQIEKAEDIESVEAIVNPVVLDVMGVKDPKDGLQSKFSMYHCFAIGFLYGRAGLNEYTDKVARDPAVSDLRRRVHATLDSGIAMDAALVTVRTTSGDYFRHHVVHATGSEAVPMTDEQLREKARLAATPILGDRTDQLLTTLNDIDTLENVRTLTEAASGAEDAAHA